MYGTSRDIQRALTDTPVIDDSAARNRSGATLDIPPPTFGPWTLRRADGTLWERDPETGEWVPVDTTK